MHTPSPPYLDAAPLVLLAGPLVRAPPRLGGSRRIRRGSGDGGLGRAQPFAGPVPSVEPAPEGGGQGLWKQVV